jgi:hypothetical protein
MTRTGQYVDKVVSALLRSGARMATKFVDPKHVVRATRRRYRGRVSTKGTQEIVLTVGRPNYAERAFIARAKRASEPFPVKKVQLRFAK